MINSMEINNSFSKVSILIPCFNAERWVSEAIESALKQTWPNKEVIVVDDGSTDGSRGVIESFGQQIRYEFGPNRGGNPCRNRLMELASGEWVQFLDADDYLLPEKISKQMECSESADIVYGPIIIRSEEFKNEKISNPNTGIDIFEQWLRWNVCQTGGVLWKKNALVKIGGWNEKFDCCQDNEVCLRAIKAGLKFVFSADPGAVYRIWSEDTVCRKNPKRLILIKTQLIDDMMEWLKFSGKLQDSHVSAAGQMTFEMARMLTRHSIFEASAYARVCKAKGVWNPIGPAAARSFCIVMNIFGFGFAELIAKIIRK